MTIAEILQGVRLRNELPNELGRAPVTGLEYDSRRVQSGFLFFAFPGARTDGREFANQAIAKGAVATVSELPAPAGVIRDEVIELRLVAQHAEDNLGSEAGIARIELIGLRQEQI